MQIVTHYTATQLQIYEYEYEKSRLTLLAAENETFFLLVYGVLCGMLEMSTDFSALDRR